MRNEREMEKTGQRSVRRLKTALACVCMTLAAVVAVGCGSTDETVGEPEVIKIETSREAGEDNGVEPDDGVGAESGKENVEESDSDGQAADGNAGQQINDDVQSDKLIGTVKSIGENSVIVSRAFEEAPDELVQAADDSPEEVLLTVSFSETTTYEIATVKNGGVGGESDVERTEGSFSDMKEGVNADFYGSFEGDGFRADKVIIYNFKN